MHTEKTNCILIIPYGHLWQGNCINFGKHFPVYLILWLAEIRISIIHRRFWLHKGHIYVRVMVKSLIHHMQYRIYLWYSLCVVDTDRVILITSLWHLVVYRHTQLKYLVHVMCTCSQRLFIQCSLNRWVALLPWTMLFFSLYHDFHVITSICCRSMMSEPYSWWMWYIPYDRTIVAGPTTTTTK